VFPPQGFCVVAAVLMFLVNRFNFKEIWRFYKLLMAVKKLDVASTSFTFPLKLLLLSSGAKV